MAERLRTLLHAFSTFSLGGAQARFVQLANATAGRYRHVVAAMDDQWQAGERLSPQVVWQPLKVQRLPGQLANRGPFRQLLARERPDLVLSYNWGAIEWVAANVPALVPHVHVEDGFGPEEAQAQLPRRQWTRRVLLGLAGKTLVVPSRRLLAAGRGWWVPPARLHYIPNGVPVAPQACARPVPAGPGIVIGTVCGLRAEKNLPRLLRAFAALPAQLPARLEIVGEGAERPALEALARALGVAGRVTFTGYLPQPQQRLQGFDLFVLSSDTEQQPISMLEAMALGIPVVATRVGDIAHMLAPQAHAGLSAVDDAAFAATLAQALAMRGDWPAWAAANLQRVRQHFSAGAMHAQWQRVFDGQVQRVPPLQAPA